MNALLGEESGQFWEALEKHPARKGLRVNTLKTTPGELLTRIPGEFTPLPWTERGFLSGGEHQLGKHPFHVAGLFYLQEPSAMIPAVILDPQPGELILDLAAAPGGKTTQIAALMDNQGALVANDPHPQRLAALQQNLKRCGVKIALVTQAQPAQLADQLGPVFDRVLVDAPCSGEGMFRAHPAEIKRWSSSFTERITHLQNEILWHAARLVRPGGVLVYSTCTFNPHENEARIEQLLAAREDFQVKPIAPQPGFSPGRPEWTEARAEIAGCVRIWPHRGPGEGHFIARLVKDAGSGDDVGPGTNFPARPPDRTAQETLKQFLDSVSNDRPLLPGLSSPEFILHQVDDRLYLTPNRCPDLGSIRTKMWGWELGRLKGDAFQPDHALALGLSRKAVHSMIEFPLEGRDILRYFRGLTFPSRQEDGWLVATTAGYPVGWAQGSGGRVKSYSPRWLRQF
jgi:NOL1/NOP2/sun family putative RNA methylase